MAKRPPTRRARASAAPPEKSVPMRRFTIRATTEQWASWQRSAQAVKRTRNDWIRVTLDYVARD